MRTYRDVDSQRKRAMFERWWLCGNRARRETSWLRCCRKADGHADADARTCLLALAVSVTMMIIRRQTEGEPVGKVSVQTLLLLFVNAVLGLVRWGYYSQT